MYLYEPETAEYLKEIQKYEGLWSVVQADQLKALTNHKVSTATVPILWQTL